MHQKCIMGYTELMKDGQGERKTDADIPEKNKKESVRLVGG